MNKAVFAGLTALALAAAGPALAHGPSGSHEEDPVQRCIDDATGQEVPRNADGTCPDGSTDTTFIVYDNQVACGSGTDVAGVSVYAGPNGVEACNDDADLPAQGRIIATTDDGGYVAADGDADNPTEAQGWIRVDQSGVRCGDTAGNLDSTHPGPEDGQDDCGQ